MENYSPKTISDYLNQLRFFVSYLQTAQIEELSGIDKETIHQYQLYLYGKQRKDKPLSLETQYARLVPLKTFFRWLVKRGYFLYDPTTQLELPKRKKNLPKGIMTRKEINRILSQPDPECLLGLRDKAILELLYSTGIRNSELRNLTIYDADTSHGELRINQGKGRKDRIIPLGEIAAKYLETYLQISRPLLVHPVRDSQRQEKPDVLAGSLRAAGISNGVEQQKEKNQNLLFISKNGRKITLANLLWLIAKYTNQAKITKHITAHSFRHTCATHMLRGKSNLRYIQELLGHSSIATTQIYTRVEVSDLKREHKRCHPREKTAES